MQVVVDMATEPAAGRRWRTRPTARGSTSTVRGGGGHAAALDAGPAGRRGGQARRRTGEALVRVDAVRRLAAGSVGDVVGGRLRGHARATPGPRDG